MKRTQPSFGHVEMDYRLMAIFKRAVTDFENADSERTKIDEEHERARIMSDEMEKMNLIQPMIIASQRRIEAGVVLLMTAGALQEQIINDYAHRFLDPEAYEEHLDSMRIVSKWIVLPRLCQNKEINKNDPAINSLRELVKARNAVVHSRKKEMYLDPVKAVKQVDSENARFFAACRKASETIDALVKILRSSPPETAELPDAERARFLAASQNDAATIKVLRKMLNEAEIRAVTANVH